MLNGLRGATNEHRTILTRKASIDSDTIEVVNRILAKDLRCGAAIKLFKKYIPDLPIHEVGLCIDDIDKYWKYTKGQTRIWQIKLDGVRNWAVVEEQTVRYVSRNGKEFPNFSVFDKELVELAEILVRDHGYSYPIIFDGEVISVEKDFQKQMTQVRRIKQADPSCFRFVIFDLVKSGMYGDRFGDVILAETDLQPRLISTISSVEFTKREEIDDALEKVTKDGEEGLILKTWEHSYEYKRTPFWCKVKKFYTEDLPVLAWEYGTGKNSDKLGYMICDFNGVEVHVGSGFSDQERRDFMTDTPKMIEVKYQEITKDGSMRFPTFVRVRDDK